MLVNCRECDKVISSNSKFCVHCGIPMNKSIGLTVLTSLYKGIGWLILIIIFPILLFFGLVILEDLFGPISWL